MSMAKIKLFSMTSHIKCNKPFYLHYRYLQNCDQSCIDCCSTIFPFNTLSRNKNFLACCSNTDNNITEQRDLEYDHDSSLSLTPSNLELLVNQFNKATQKTVMTLKKFLHPNIMTEEMCNIEIPHKNKINQYPYSI